MAFCSLRVKARVLTLVPHDLASVFSVLLHSPSLCSSYVGLLAVAWTWGVLSSGASYLVPSAWNCLPSDIFTACSLISFASLSKCHLLRRPFPNHTFTVTPPLPFPVFPYGTYCHLIYHNILLIYFLIVQLPLFNCKPNGGRAFCLLGSLLHSQCLE